MKNIRYIALLLLSLILLDQLANGLMGYLYRDTLIGEAGGKINYFLKNKKSVGILAMGNSRCAHHVVPEIIGKNTFNLSHNGMSLSFQAGLFHQIVEIEKVMVDTLLLQIDFSEMFDSTLSENRDIQQLKYFYDKNDWIRDEINALSRFEHVKYFFSSYKWNGKVISLLVNRLKSQLSNPAVDGYVALEPTERDSTNVVHQLKVAENTGAKNHMVSPTFMKYHLQPQEIHCGCHPQSSLQL